MTTLRPELPEPIPTRILQLPVHRGYPVPWFVAWLDDDQSPLPRGEGVPDFRVLAPGAVAEAMRYERCWICGGRMGANRAFVVGPMCAVNRTSAEPPSHVSCAEWSARACPFLTRPKMDRREKGLPADATDMPGIALMRNPGVALVWVSRRYTTRRIPAGLLSGLPAGHKLGAGLVFDIGEPDRVMWLCEGREATRAEVDASIESGIGSLRELAEAQGPLAVGRLDHYLERAERVLPAA